MGFEKEKQNTLHNPAEEPQVVPGLGMTPPEFSLANGTETPPDLVDPMEMDEDLAPSDQAMPMMDDTETDPSTEDQEMADVQGRMEEEEAVDGLPVVQMVRNKNTTQQRNYWDKYDQVKNNYTKSERAGMKNYINNHPYGRMDPSVIGDGLKKGQVLGSNGRLIWPSKKRKTIDNRAQFDNNPFKFLNKRSKRKNGKQVIEIPPNTLGGNYNGQFNYRNKYMEKVKYKWDSTNNDMIKEVYDDEDNLDRTDRKRRLTNQEVIKKFEKKRRMMQDMRDSMDPNNDKEEIKYFHQGMVEMSEQIGEECSRIAMEQMGGNLERLNTHTKGGKQGEFDQGYAQRDNKGNISNVFLNECKGGSSTLGSRMDKKGKRNQQGTKEYRDDITDMMLDPKQDKKVRESGQIIQDGAKNNQLSYFKFQVPVDRDSNIQNIQISKFMN